MKTLTITDQEFITLCWGVQLGCAAALENPHWTDKSLLISLLRTREIIETQGDLVGTLLSLRPEPKPEP